MAAVNPISEKELKRKFDEQHKLGVPGIFKNGNPDAQLYVGWAYEKGKGVERNYTKAIRWYERAALQGCSGALHSLAFMYAQGDGVKIDNIKAIELWKKSANQGNTEAQTKLGYLYEKGECELPKNYLEAVKWYRKAAGRGNVLAQKILARMYEEGQGVNIDNAKALEWFQKAATSGDSDAQKNYERAKMASARLSHQPFLALVTEGEQEMAEALLKQTPALAHTPSDVTDLSGRSFKTITGFQYAVWALDWHMWRMIRKYLPDEAAKEQIARMKNGAWVQQYGASAEPLLQNLIDTLQACIDLLVQKKYDEGSVLWNKKVGSAQRLLPVHVVNEYCRADRPFEPCPDFTTVSLPRNRVSYGSEWYTATWDNGGLGEAFANIRSSFDHIFKFDGFSSSGWFHGVPWHTRLSEELRTCQVLLNTRVQQRDKLFDEFQMLPLSRQIEEQRFIEEAERQKAEREEKIKVEVEHKLEVAKRLKEEQMKEGMGQNQNNDEAPAHKIETASASKDNLLTPDTIDYNELKFGKELGRGGFGIVYHGTWRHSDIAIKQLLMNNLSAKTREEFENESKIMGSLRAPNIVQFYGYTLSPRYCIVMEYMPKGSLFSVLHSNQELTWGNRIRIAADMAKGLAFLHQEGILHRDIKSLNVLLNNHLEAKLTDFGLSKVKNESQSTTIQSSAGTYAWMAPELATSDDGCTRQTDIYSLGITFWELTSREIPFKKVAKPSLIPIRASQGVRDEIPADCPAKLASLIKACWETEPEKRPNADEVASFLYSDKEEFNQFLPYLRAQQSLMSSGYQGNLNSISSASASSSSSSGYQNNFNSPMPHKGAGVG